jgi:predicted permease
MRAWGVKRLFRDTSRTRDDVRRDVRDEIAFHLEMRVEELIRAGMSAADAHGAARREFGALDAGTHALARIDDGIERRRRLGRFFGELRQDASMGARLLVRSPGFAAVAVLTLALGIGANTTIYSGLDAAVLRPLPYPSPSRLVLVSETREDGGRNSSSGGAFLDWRASRSGFEALVLTGRATTNLRHGSTTERLVGMEVSHEFLQVLGIAPLLGRGFQPEDDRPGGRNAVVMLTEELWRSRFNADSSLVGRTIVLDEVPHEVIGVLPRRGWMLKDVTFFVPAVLAPGTDRARRAPHWAGVFGRLGPGVTAAQAQSGLLAVKARLNDQYPVFKKRWGVSVQPVTDVIAGLTRTPMLLLLGAVSVVLLIACANVANLLLARSCHRQQELAVRAALGASGARLVRQVLTENLVLTLLGGTAGVLLAYGGVEVLRWLTVDALPLEFAPRLDHRVLAGALAVTLVTGPLVGLLPALRARRLDPGTTMSGGSKGVAAGGGSQRTKAALVVVEVALTVTLLASAGLLLRSLAHAASADPGFHPDRILAFDVSLPDVSYASRERRLVFASELVQRLRALPGVEGAGTGLAIPYASGGFGEFFARGDRQSDPVLGRVNFVSPGYLEALGARLIAGRGFADTDNRADGPRVVLISERTRRMFYPGENPVGQTMVIRGERWEVIGVVSDVVDRRPDTPPGAYAYVPSARSGNSPSVIVRTALDPLALLPLVRAAVAGIDPGVAVANPRPLNRARVDSMNDRRFVLALLGAFAAAALTLASLGVYGVMAYAVATRRREFGIRLACGALRSDVMRDVFRRGLIVTSIGLGLGLAGAAGAARLIGSQLYQVSATDPFVAVTTAATVMGAALAACWLPAWRASRVDPASALRAD